MEEYKMLNPNELSVPILDYKTVCLQYKYSI